MFADKSIIVAKRSMIIETWSIEFDFGLCTFVVPEESNVVAMRSTGHLKPVF